MSLEELLAVFGSEAEREGFLQLGRRFCDAQRGNGSRTADDAVEGGESLLDQLMHRVQVQYRAIRRPLPRREELMKMILDHFG